MKGLPMFNSQERLIKPSQGESEPLPFHDDGKPVELPDFLLDRESSDG